MHLVEVQFMSPLFDACFALRNKILRKPLGLRFEASQIRQEYKEKHWTIVSDNFVVMAYCTYKNIGKNTWKMRQVCVNTEYQSMGIGSELVRLTEQAMTGNYGMKRVELAARIGAVEFYKKLGYSPDGNIFEEIGIPHQKMTKKMRH